jgi:hypothetical protein
MTAVVVEVSGTSCFGAMYSAMAVLSPTSILSESQPPWQRPYT